MAQHTPGPWQPFDTDGKPVNDPSVVSKKHVLATVWINDLSRKQAIANATLMAAAPDMLAELRDILDFALDERAPLGEPELASIRAVIAKAETQS